MVVALIIVSMLLILQTGYLLVYRSQIRDIGKQLDFIGKHGSFKWISTQIKPPEVERLMGSCNVLLQRQRELEQQFARRNEEINTTIISLSHDIRTPLTALDGYLQLAERTDEPEDHAHYIQQAQSRTSQMIQLVDELFLYTKLQNPEYCFELEALELNAVLSRNLIALIDDFSRIGHEPTLELPDHPLWIKANGNALERVFANILQNYLLHGAGSLSIRYENYPDTARLVFFNSLRDDQPVQIERVFTRFYKEDSSRTVRSSGLGLAIVKSLMEKMNGNADAKLENGEFHLGITFCKTEKAGETKMRQ
ncbi:sensor histidine kinase [Paenibacillus sp. CAU 1782]